MGCIIIDFDKVFIIQILWYSLNIWSRSKFFTNSIMPENKKNTKIEHNMGLKISGSYQMALSMGL